MGATVGEPPSSTAVMAPRQSAVRSSRWRQRLGRNDVWCIAATFAAALPIVGAAVRGWVSGWEPTADDAMIATRAWDVFTSHPPLLGMWASASLSSGRNFNHPSALAFDVLAPLVRLLGAGRGTLVTVAAVNVAAVVAIAWLVRRRLGPGGAALVMVAITTLVWSLGSAVLIDPWPMNWPILMFLLLLVSAWSVTAGDAVALVPLVVAGSFCLGSHLSYVVLVPAIVITALALFVVGVVRLPHADENRRVAVRWSVIAVVVGLACWVQPLWDEVRGHPGNLTVLAQSSGLHERTTPDAALMLRIIGGTVVLPPAWLPPTFAHPTFHANGSGVPLWLAAVAVAALIGVWIWLARSAWRRRDRTTLAALSTAAIGLGAGAVTVMRMPVHSGIGYAYLRWLWPLGLYVWVATTLAVVQAVRVHQSSATTHRYMTSPRVTQAGVAVAGIACCVAIVGALFPADNGSDTSAWGIAASKDVVSQALRRLPRDEPVLVEGYLGNVGDQVKAPLVDALVRRGTKVTFPDVVSLHQYGNSRRWDGRDISELAVAYGPAAVRTPAGARRIGFRAGLDSHDRANLERATADLRARLRQLGGMPLTPFGQFVVASMHGGHRLAADPDAVLDDPRHVLVSLYHGPTQQFWGKPLLDTARLNRQVLDTYTRLQGMADTQTVAVFEYAHPLRAAKRHDIFN